MYLVVLYLVDRKVYREGFHVGQGYGRGVLYIGALVGNVVPRLRVYVQGVYRALAWFQMGGYVYFFFGCYLGILLRLYMATMHFFVYVSYLYFFVYRGVYRINAPFNVISRTIGSKYR